MITTIPSKGTYVRDRLSGRRGRVLSSYTNCPYGDEWLRDAVALGPNPMRFIHTPWIDVLSYGVGSFMVPLDLLEEIPPFAFKHPDNHYYFWRIDTRV